MAANLKFFLIDLIEGIHSFLDQSRKNLAVMVDYFISTPVSSIKQAQQSTGLGSFVTLQGYIEKLEVLGIVREVTGKARGRMYKADKILHILEG